MRDRPLIQFLGPIAFTAGWVWTGARTPQIPHATRSVSALSAGGQPFPGQVLVGQLVLAACQRVTAGTLRRLGYPRAATALTIAGTSGLVATAVRLPTPEGPRWQDHVHTGASAVCITALHLAPLSIAVDPHPPAVHRMIGLTTLAVALPCTGYFLHRLVYRAGVGRAYGYAERITLTVLLGWAATAPLTLPSRTGGRPGPTR